VHTQGIPPTKKEPKRL